MATLMPCLPVGLGGFIGANTRCVVARLVGALFETRFPLGTFVINISGSFLLGVLGTLVAQKMMPNSESMRLAAWGSWARSPPFRHSSSKPTRYSTTARG
jgi:CrcB protein